MSVGVSPSADGGLLPVTLRFDFDLWCDEGLSIYTCKRVHKCEHIFAFWRDFSNTRKFVGVSVNFPAKFFVLES